MKMRALYAVLLTGSLLFAAACSGTASASGESTGSPEDPAQSAATESDTAVNTPPDMAVSQGNRPDGRPGKDAGIMGEIAALSEMEITLKLSSMEVPADGDRRQRPDGERPIRNEEEPPELPSGAERRTPTEPPSDGAGGGWGRGPGGDGGGWSMAFSEEATVYTLSAEVTVKKGMGENEQTLSVSDLAVDDVVRVELDGDGRVTAIQVMDFGTGEPPQASDSESEASA